MINSGDLETVLGKSNLDILQPVQRVLSNRGDGPATRLRSKDNKRGGMSVYNLRQILMFGNMLTMRKQLCGIKKNPTYDHENKIISANMKVNLYAINAPSLSESTLINPLSNRTLQGVYMNNVTEEKNIRFNIHEILNAINAPVVEIRKIS